jgi:hypothetical protein
LQVNRRLKRLFTGGENAEYRQNKLFHKRGRTGTFEVRLKMTLANSMPISLTTSSPPWIYQFRERASKAESKAEKYSHTCLSTMTMDIANMINDNASVPDLRAPHFKKRPQIT